MHKGRVETSAASAALRNAAVDLWFPKPDATQPVKSGKRRATIKHFLNGNWSRRDAVEHYCPDGCCPDAATAKQRMMRLLPFCLIPYSSCRVSQHRWTQSL